MAASRRGRPQKFNPESRLGKHMGALVRRHGLTGAHRILTARKGSKLAAERKVEDRVQVSIPTLRKVAAARGVELKRGPRPVAA